MTLDQFSGRRKVVAHQFKWNDVIYDDCLNERTGLPFLDSLVKAGTIDPFDLCLTDIPYNKDFKYLNQRTDGKRIKPQDHLTPYADNKGAEEYVAFCKEWFRWIRQIAKVVIFTAGDKKNLDMWYDIEKPVEVFIHYKRNGTGMTSLVRYNRRDFILLYGTFNHKLDFVENVFDISVKSGFLRDHEWIHPSPKPLKLGIRIIKDMIKSQSIKTMIDPFTGSGTFLQAAAILGVKYLGYEISKTYKPDIDYRLNARRRTQTNLFTFMKGSE